MITGGVVGVGSGVGVNVGVGSGVGVNVGIGEGSTGGFAQPVVTVAVQTVGVGVGVTVGVGLTIATPLFHTIFLPLLMHVNFLPA